ncbi:YjeF family domain-containing protein [Acinetobacter bouvetii DSM 14964 = CIP 107468]|uniref:ADP-dependent (S)-NAD(P)H-hydrate dehydratase n=1 Tax=Acinetobacter bouvetii DSM 14964 = CIP 107468 TaxID=1120925 RepID=N9CAT0_9GAMM|nr:bifunctional ADP-dependent NAD(P)H-hydrate dehydratase/NAD(P)H-hydrate epimerase [Acinetobacter bouvetii]ENV82601.1 YjeF family domain-containing protein [Acinetobacter bouvetii DSM 14964 = CIP 107468]BCU64400.1 NAD(P)H-hydrate epimerase [Acinetobacter bouvetii]
MQPQVYHSQSIQAWEQRWFSQQNSSYGLMKQVAWTIAQRLIPIFHEQGIQRIAVCCGQGNNAGDGYLTAKYLTQAGFSVDIYAAELGASKDLHLASAEAQQAGLTIYSDFTFVSEYDAYIDALFGIGLNRELNTDWQSIIQKINGRQGLRIAVDIPSGLQANSGQPLPCAVKADYTFTALGLKAGLFTGQGKEFCGKVQVIDVIPADEKLQPIARISPNKISLPQRQAFGHKGSYGHVLIAGGHATMGGAVIMAAEAAFHAGAGKVTCACDAKHHTAILSRAPNIMLRDINALSAADIQALLEHVDAVSFGMGLGRDAWAEQQFKTWFPLIQQSDVEAVLDADALWFLAEFPEKLKAHSYATPHSGEAAKLLGISTQEVEADRVQAIHFLQEKYAGQWVLKGAGSLILEDELWICTAGNAGMGTGGMGDVLAGMISSLKAQFHDMIHLHEIVTLHALAGDYLAQRGMRGLQAQDMAQAVYHAVNL